MHACTLLLLYIGDRHYHLFVHWFNFDQENNIPTLFSTLMFLTAAMQLSLIGTMERKKQHAWGAWRVLAVIFIFMAVDENCTLHEGLIDPVREMLSDYQVTFSQTPPPSAHHRIIDLFYYAWLLPYVVLSLIAAILFIPFFKRLPKDTFYRFALAALLFFGGAVGFEMLGGRYIYYHGGDNVVYYYLMFTTPEETLEFLGAICFNYALAYHIEQHMGGMTVAIAPAKEP